MSQFTTELVVEPIGDGRYVLVEPFEYHVGCYPSDEVIKVPVGFDTDFASVPKFAQWLIAKRGKHDKADVVHDYCYRYGLYNKYRCDIIYLEAMTVLDVPKWKRTIMFTSVLLFGWASWFKDRYNQYIRSK